MMTILARGFGTVHKLPPGVKPFDLTKGHLKKDVDVTDAEEIAERLEHAAAGQESGLSPEIMQQVSPEVQQQAFQLLQSRSGSNASSSTSPFSQGNLPALGGGVIAQLPPWAIPVGVAALCGVGFAILKMRRRSS